MKKEEIKFSVLLVDDSASVRGYLKSILKEVGFTNLFEAENGLSALECVKKHGIDLIISDWNMPKMDGLALVNKIRETHEFSHIKFLMLTTESEKEKVLLAIKSSVDGYIVKPFTPISVITKIKKYIE
ncbi:MAG: response regulator [Gammaproteobacteria bacterium]|nr:MAG: response regulator [Gammaproteobacteria bacterium]